MQRRHLLALGASTWLTGCGFELRREPEFHFQTVALAGFAANSPLALELKRQIQRTPLKLLEDPNRAQVVLEAQRDWRDKSSVATTSAGQIREWQLKLSLDYLIRTAGGDILLPVTELRLSRDMNYTESNALGKEQEEAALQKAMQVEAVGLLLRRLAAIHLPG